ncbi:hypothetical protein M4951_21495 [Blastopirellula sp. J2-11]|uniref:hypothetical protein n=1 Tax=Blastopirellula sp. J2-11 TaxID=2943192 RepID=UPI0021C95818|nr:hypothetical protein [Blastopirellula sp. J2-11]UUO05929.1 hypothetical protein M4951_21495 [Blastopirellula sp. J2-11]
MNSTDVAAEEISPGIAIAREATWLSSPVGRSAQSLLLLVVGIAVVWSAAELLIVAFGNQKMAQVSQRPLWNIIAVSTAAASRQVPICWAAIVIALPIGRFYGRALFCLLLAASTGLVLHMTDPWPIPDGPDGTLVEATLVWAKFLVIAAAALSGRWCANLINGAHRTGAPRFSLWELLSIVLFAAIIVAIAKTLVPWVEWRQFGEMGKVVSVIVLMQCATSLLCASGPIIAWMLPGRTAKRVTIWISVLLMPLIGAGFLYGTSRLFDGIGFLLSTGLSYTTAQTVILVISFLPIIYMPLQSAKVMVRAGDPDCEELEA